MFISNRPDSWVVKSLSSIVKAAAPVCALAALTLAMSGCGSSEGDARSTRTAAAKQTLIAGDQLNHLQSLLLASGEDKPEDYALDWANFVTGPAIIAAATGGSVDIGWMAETPLVFAQAAGSPVKVIAASVPVVPGNASIGVVVSAESPIQSYADLKDKKVFHLPGTILQYVLVEQLASAGLGLKDIHTVSATTGTGAGPQMLVSGVVDAAVLVEPALSQAELNPKLRVLRSDNERLHGGTRLYVVPTRILEDENVKPLIEEFLVRANRAFQWQREHHEDALKHTAALYKLPIEQAEAMLRRSGTHFVPIDNEVITSLQRQADTFADLGILRKQIDVSEVFDTRFNYLFENKASETPSLEHNHFESEQAASTNQVDEHQAEVGSLSQDNISN